MDVLMIPYELEEGMTETVRCVEKIEPGQSIGIFIGPEGGFDVNEIEILQDDHFIPVTLGKRILRAETAAIYALSCIDYQHALSKEEK